MDEHPAREVAQHGVEVLARWRVDPPGIRAVVGVVVDAPPRAERLARAERPLVTRQVESAAVDDRRRPAVEQEGVAAVEPDAGRLHPVVTRVHPHGDGERQRQRCRPEQPGLSTRTGDQRERDAGNHEHPAHDADGHGQTEERSGDRQRRVAGALPEQQHDRGEHQRLEKRLGHDVVFDLQLVRVQQDGRGGEHGDPPTATEPHEHGIDRDAHRQAEKVLHGGDRGEGADREHRPQEEHDVTDRLGLPRAEVVQVLEILERIDEQQRRPVRDLRHDSKQRARAEDNEEDPVSSRADPHPCPCLLVEPARAPIESSA